MDCFSAVKVFFKLANFYEVLYYINTHIDLTGKSANQIKYFKQQEKEAIQITPIHRPYGEADTAYWAIIGVTLKQLVRDGVNAINAYLYKKNDKRVKVLTAPLCYCIPVGDKYKIYSPFGSKKFFTNCQNDDVGNLRELPDTGDILLITKSYKDCRILRNLGYFSIWVQSETMFPNPILLLQLCLRFTRIIILFDNDRAGYLGAKQLQERIEGIGCKAETLHYPNLKGVTDTAEYYATQGEVKLIKFLKTNIDE
jgi:hypothetical protein